MCRHALADKILEDAQLRDTLLSTADVRTHAVVLFADLRGFTSISERLEPHEVVPLLNEYFSLLTEITFRHDGTVFHMAGDSLMLGFGVPLEQPDSPQRAVRAAREMPRKLRRARPLVERAVPDRGRLGIGINEGDVVPQHRLHRLHELHDHRRHGEHRRPPLPESPRGEMLFSLALKKSLDKDGFDVGCTHLPAMQLRGRTAPIDIYCVPTESRVQVSEPAVL